MRPELIDGTPAQLAALARLGIGRPTKPDPADDVAALIAKGYAPEMAARIAGGTLVSRDRSRRGDTSYPDDRYQ